MNGSGVPQAIVRTRHVERRWFSEVDDEFAKFSTSGSRKALAEIGPEKLAILMDVKNHHYGRVSDYAARTGVKFEANVRPWHVKVDVALPCATQNELDENDAKTLIQNGVLCVAEGGVSSFSVQ